MTKEAITQHLTKNHEDFIQYLKSLSEADFSKSPAEKWNAGQQLDHIVRSVQPMVMAFRLPTLILGWYFGKSSRPSKTYEELVAKYNAKLQAGGRASSRFVPPPSVSMAQRDVLCRKLTGLIETLNRRVLAIEENQLDALILPHPLLGKVTLREMLYFSIYHVEHHHEITKRNLDSLA